MAFPGRTKAGRLGFEGLSVGAAQTINALGKKARDGTLSIDEMAGGTFTISNGGVYGSLLSTPIINPPQSAILGMHSINPRAAVCDSSLASTITCSCRGASLLSLNA